MKITKMTTFKAVQDNHQVVIKVTSTTKYLTEGESQHESKKLNNEIFNALHENGFHCQDISIK